MDPPINFAFIAFPLEDIDTLVLKKFSPDNSFQNLLDTISLFNNVNSSLISFGDTTHINGLDPYRNITPGFDWQIYIPARNQTINISEIIKEKRTEKCAALSTQCYCYNKIISIKIDNQNASFKSYPSYFLFIK